jgi:hypothetical protein
MGMARKLRKSGLVANMDNPFWHVGAASLQRRPVDRVRKKPPEVAKDKDTGYSVGNAASANDHQVGGKHYKQGIEHWDYVLSKNIPYMEAQIIKYVERWRDKNGLQDLEKARHFLDKLIEHEGNKSTKGV